MNPLEKSGLAYLWSKIKSLVAGYLPLTGGTLTGNLTGRYITGTWLQGTASNHHSTKQNKVVVQDASGWLYHRTLDEFRGDLGFKVVSNVSVAASAWASDSTFPDYPYKAAVSISGITADWICTAITPDHTNRSLDYLFCPYVQTGANVLYVWANAKPTAAITFETIRLEL